jgi:hypothetical protein
MNELQSIGIEYGHTHTFVDLLPNLLRLTVDFPSPNASPLYS